MKLLIYVSPDHARANASPIAGAVDYLPSRRLQDEIHAADLDAIAIRFAVADATVPAPDVHRLSCASATNAGILDALSMLAHRLDRAAAWARRHRGLPPTDVPAYVARLWTKHPLALYRDLLGPDVAAAIVRAPIIPA